MTSIHTGIERSPPKPMPGARARWKRMDRTLRIAGLALLALAPATMALALVDDRVLDGSPIWHKPLKFQVSVAIFLLTLACMTPLAGRRFRRSAWGRGAVWIAITTGVFEVVWITMQAGLGARSHYNTDSTFGSAMYSVMGVAAVALSLTPVVTAIAIVTRRRTGPRFAIIKWGLVLGVLVSLVGTAGVGIMLGGSPDHYPQTSETLGERLPLIGWSTTGGDLRIAHFVGMHAMQGLFVLALLLAWRSVPAARACLVVIALGWLGATAALARLAVNDVSPFSLWG
ncbi:MAG: hypothetical protein AAF612_03345 [Planctomycetota bacterium]